MMVDTNVTNVTINLEVCASLPAVDPPEILHRQPRGWFAPAIVGFDQADFFLQTKPGSKEVV